MRVQRDRPLTVQRLYVRESPHRQFSAGGVTGGVTLGTKSVTRASWACHKMAVLGLSPRVAPATTRAPSKTRCALRPGPARRAPAHPPDARPARRKTDSPRRVASTGATECWTD